MKITDLLENATSEKQQNMKATDLLRQDHERVRELFGQYRSLMDEDTGDVEKRDLFLQIEREVSVHSQAEEEIFYPAVRKAPTDDAERLVLESFEEHALVTQLLEQLRRAKPQDETFDAKMKVLMDLVEHHVEEEENEMFPEAEELGDKALDRLGREIAERKQALMSESSSSRRRSSSRGRSSTASRRTTRSTTRSTRGKSRTSRTSRGTSSRRTASSSRSTASKSTARRASAGARARKNGRKKGTTRRS